MKNRYPFIFVHGMFGWGEKIGIDKISPYWGGTTGSLMKYLRKQGYECYSASVGPVASAWDDACELYAQLMGTRVDYGKAHSEAHGHRRFGRTYKKPLCEGFGKRKFHLIGHSHGGQVIRLLAHLLTYGDETEKNATDSEDISPLFTGGKADYIESITTICSPHNGSTLYQVVEDKNLLHTLGRFTDFMMGLIGRTPFHGRFVDYQFEQFGLTPVKGEFKPDKLFTAMNRIRDGEDYVLSDLSLKGAYELNKMIEISDSIHYFSYAANGCVGNEHKSKNMNFFLLKMFSHVLVRLPLPENDYGLTFDESWRPNDGLVNTVSAKNPADEPAKDFDGKIEKGIWNVMPVLECDHGGATGLLTGRKRIHKLYTDLAEMLTETEK